MERYREREERDREKYRKVDRSTVIGRLIDRQIDRWSLRALCYYIVPHWEALNPKALKA